MTHDLDEIPAFLRLTAEERNVAWVKHPPKAMPAFGIARTPTEIAYYQSIEHDKARRRARDEVRWAELKARKDADKAEIEAVRMQVKRRKK